jgi:S-(hydroxymethyl)glutathione dehydrogenase/alcohol dehydrogenase
MTLPKKMRAAILTEIQKPLIVDEVELPASLDFGQVLVKLHFTGICGSQLGEIAGAKGPDTYLPHLLGHEGSGVVEGVGPMVKLVKPGDNVVLHWRKGDGIDAPTPKYSWRGKTLNAGSVTTFNEYAVVSENRVTPIPANFPMYLAPLFGCAVTTGIGAINNKAKLILGESVLVMGAGGVGLNVVQAASMQSAYPIVAVDRFDGRIDLAKTMGATHIVSSNDKDWVAQARSIVGRQGFDVVVENTGNPNIISECWKLAGAEGRLVLIGVPAKENEAKLYTLPLHFGKVLTGTHGGDGNPSVDIPRYIKLHSAGKLVLDKLVTKEFSLDQINSALDEMRSGSLSGRCVVKF